MEDNAHVIVGSKEYSREQCEIMFKQLMEGEPSTSAEDAEAVVLSQLGYLWHNNPPYHQITNGSKEIRNIINALSTRILHLMVRLNQEEQKRSQLTSRLIGE